MLVRLKERQSELRLIVQSHFRKLAAYDIDELSELRFGERMRHFDTAVHCAIYLEDYYFPLEGYTVLVPACGWGGAAIAFAATGSKVVACDDLDYHFGLLQDFARKNQLDIQTTRANEANIPYPNESFDVVIAIDLVEHSWSVDRFAEETARVLKPGGLCVVVTPPRMLSVLRGEPHYARHGLAALPLPLQLLSTLSPIGMKYEKPICHQFGTPRSLIRRFERYGLNGRVVPETYPARCTVTERAVRHIAKRLFWDSIVLTRSSG